MHNTKYIYTYNFEAFWAVLKCSYKSSAAWIFDSSKTYIKEKNKKSISPFSRNL